MAGDWIKMGKDLLTHPKVVRMASALHADKLRTVGGLFAVWCLFDTHSVDGQLYGYTAETIDDEIRFPGFCAAMESVGWIETSPDGSSLPDFEEHNGQSAKRRAQETDRKRNERKTSACDADKKRTREEKRREEKNSSSLRSEEGAARAKRKPSPTPMPVDFDVSERVAAWAAEKGYESLPLHLEAFRAKVKAKGYEYVDWDSAFMEAIREDWAKLRGHGQVKGQAPPPDRSSKPWWETGPGIRKKGIELGIGDWREGEEQWHPYMNKVMQAAKQRGMVLGGG